MSRRRTRPGKAARDPKTLGDVFVDGVEGLFEELLCEGARLVVGNDPREVLERFGDELGVDLSGVSDDVVRTFAVHFNVLVCVAWRDKAVGDIQAGRPWAYLYASDDDVFNEAARQAVRALVDAGAHLPAPVLTH